MKNQEIWVFNNEDGFNQQDFESICSVGKSTKAKKNKKIGMKGIGFKSVFKVSSKPHIFSGDFNFKLDDTKVLGKISPESVSRDMLENVPNSIKQFSENARQSTFMYLPLKKNILSYEDVFPNAQKLGFSLLFLNNLQKIQTSICLEEVYFTL